MSKQEPRINGHADAASEDEQDQTQSPQSVADELQAALAALERAQAEATEHLDHARRAQAELRNYRRRTEQEMEQFRKNATERLIAKLLPVIDDFDRALDALSEEERQAPWTQGLLLIERKLWSILEQEGVKPIEAVGQPFDPTIHEAVTVDPDAGGDASIVVEEFQRGFFLNDRVIRPSMVKVGAADGNTSQRT